MSLYRLRMRLQEWGEDFLSLLLGRPPIRRDYPDSIANRKKEKES